jgi:SnoaL-like domain
MDSSTEELTALLARGKIRDCIERLARGEDRRDAEAIRASFLPDATVDLGVFAG